MSYREIESSEELNRQKGLLQAILNSSDVGGVLLSPEKKVLFFNKTTEKDILQLWGKKITIGDDFLPYVAPTLKDEFEKEFQKALQGEIVNTEREVTDSKGNKIWLKGKYLPVYSEDNELLGLYFTIENIDQKKRAAALLKKSEEMPVKTFGATPVALAIVNVASGQIIEVNRNWLELLGFDYENVIGKTHTEIGIIDELTRQILRESINPDNLYKNIEITIQTSKGIPKTVIASFEKYEISGTPYILYTLIDISHRKAIENNINEEKQQLINIIQSAGVGTWEWNIQTKEVKRNELWANILGYTLKELQPLNLYTWEKHVHPEDLSTAKKLLNQHLAGKTKVYECELRMKHKDGYWVWVWERGQVLEWDKEGKPLKMYGIQQDITTEKLLKKQLQERNEMLANTEEELRQSIEEIYQANLKLEASQAMLKAVIDNFPEGSISLIDRDLNLLYTGGAGYKQYAINPKEFIGKPVKELLSESTYEQIISFLPEIFAGNTCSQEITFKDKIFLNVYQPIIDKDQVVHSFVLVSFDITERKKDEEKIRIQNEILVRQNDIFRQIAWLQSHDARRPVANILGLVQLIKTDEHNIQQYIDYLYKATEDLDAVIHRIVDLIQQVEMY